LVSRTGKSFSKEVIEALCDVIISLRRIKPLPREGMERPFRDYLKEKLFKEKLGWPEDKVITGEIYDLYFRDDLGFVVIYVETKSPTRKAIPQSERNRFLEKLEKLGTADYGVLTDGKVWEQYECVSDAAGKLKIKKQIEINLEQLLLAKHTPYPETKSIYDAFSCLTAQRYLDRDIIDLLEKDSGKLKFKSNPVKSNVVKEFTERLKKNLDNLNEIFVILFRGFYSGTLKTPQEFLLKAFDDWNRVSGKVPLSLIEEKIEYSVKSLLKLRTKRKISDADLAGHVRRLKRDLGVKISENFLSTVISDYLSEASNNVVLKSIIHMRVLSLVIEDVKLFCRQTSHVLLSRLLLYRVCEDKKLVVRKLSGKELARELKKIAMAPLMAVRKTRIFLDLTEEVSKAMKEVYGHLYAHNIFDWWYLSEDRKSFLKEDEVPIVERFERLLSVAIKEALKDLAIFDLAAIDRDIWKDVYQDYLPPVERNRLGGFYTPDEVVSLILDLVDYKTDTKDLCKRKLLDPACGSGTFLVEASRRLRDHILNTDEECHENFRVRSSYEKQRFCLEKIKNNIYGIDIHPFACFLSEVNLLFQTIDLLLNVRRHFPHYKLGRFNVHNADSLRKTAKLQLGLQDFLGNSRAKTFLQDIQQAEQVKKRNSIML